MPAPEPELGKVTTPSKGYAQASDIATAQWRALDDAQTAWHEAIAALDKAQRQAENLHDARPQLLPDDLFWEALGAFGGMTRMLDDLVAEVADDG